MIFFIFILLFILLKSLTPALPGKFNANYLSIEDTSVVKGLFVILVIFTHSAQYVQMSGAYDEPYLLLRSFMGQMVVCMFLFYSGYGVMESLLKKGFSYISTLPQKRLIKVLINFDIAVLLFLILDIFISNSYDLKTIILSFLGWENIGNSNWYIFAVLMLYIVTFIAYFPLKWKNSRPAYFIYTVILTILYIALVYFEMKAGKDAYYYNTIILYPLGCWYSLFKPHIDRFVMKNDYIYSLCAALLGIALVITYDHRFSHGIHGYTFWAIAFTLAIVMFTMKFSFKSTILSWFGNHIFSVYMLQRIPMMILHYFGISYTHKYFFVCISILCTIFLAQIFDHLTDLMWKKIYKK